MILSQLEQSIKTAQLASQGIIGHLNITFIGSAEGGIMVDALKIFWERFPQIQVNLRELTSALQWLTLHDGNLHIGFLSFIVPAKDINYNSLTNESLVADLPDQYPLAKLPTLSVSSLHSEPFIFFPSHLGLPFHDLIMWLRIWGFPLSLLRFPFSSAAAACFGPLKKTSLPSPSILFGERIRIRQSYPRLLRF